jgi:hypothetical protein
MTNPAWKRTERVIAARLGGQRVPVSGRQRGDAPDVAHDRLSIEVKHRKSIPGWLRDAMHQAAASSTNGRLPVAIIHTHGGRHGDDLCLIRLSDLVRLIDRGTDR